MKYIKSDLSFYLRRNNDKIYKMLNIVILVNRDLWEEDIIWIKI